MNKDLVAIRTNATLFALGVSNAYTGYKYIHDAVTTLIADRTLEKGVAVCIYPMIAEKYGTTVKAVERAIAVAIQHAWDYGAPSTQQKVFGAAWARRKKRPTNKQFIVAVANHVDIQNRNI